jgi:hypothetical protein
VEAFLFSYKCHHQIKALQQIQTMGRNFFTHHQGRGCSFFYAAMVLCILIASLQASCSLEPEKEAEVTNQGIIQNYVQDPFTLIQRISKSEISIAEQLEVVLETAVPENTDVEFPSYSASLGDFTLKDTRILPAMMTGSGDTVRVVHRVIYLLEPYLSGTYTIPAMAVTFRDRKNEAEVAKLVTVEIEVPVRSLLGPDAATVEIRDIRPPLSLPPDRIQQFLPGGLVLLLAGLAIIGFYYWKINAGKKLSTAVQPRPEEIALQELDRLLAEDLLTRGEIKLFLELSRAKSSANTLLSSHKVLLTDFLTQCDLVKFAKHEPSIAECKKTVVICREFIEKTREKEIEELSAYKTADD